MAIDAKQATHSYEQWMRKCCQNVVEGDLRYKHEQMLKDPFLYMRATYYRWAQLWPDLCPELSHAPKTMAAGDMHVGSFGTWRDAEGRMCWGVDDFDECWKLPYTNDLVRLAASVRIVADCEQLTIRLGDACNAILKGYAETLRRGGAPFVLAERDQFVEKLGIKAIKPPDKFWDKLDHLPAVSGGVGGLPKEARVAVQKTLPTRDLKCKVVRRKAGVGSLGQERFVVLAQWKGGWIARELKALVPSASVWLEDREGHGQSNYAQAIEKAVRSHDPYQTVGGRWLTRRLSPDSNPIEIADLSAERDEEKLLNAMGIEAANVHLSEKRQTDAILKDLKTRKDGWLADAAKLMAKATVKDWKDYSAA